MTTSTSFPTVLHADQEHSGIRTVVLILIAVIGWLSYLLVRAIIRAIAPATDFMIAATCAATVPLTLGLAWLAEEGLKRVWHSGRNLTLDEHSICVKDGDNEESVFDWAGNLTHLNWYFLLKGYQRGGRERRVPKDWLCLACQLQQNEERLIVYAYLPQKKAAVWTATTNSDHKFHKLNPADVYQTSLKSRMNAPTRPDIPTDVLVGKDGRFWLAERRRWQDGFELKPDDFDTFMRIFSSVTYYAAPDT